MPGWPASFSGGMGAVSFPAPRTADDRPDILFAINLLVFACAGGRWTVGHLIARVTGFRWLQNL